MLSGIEFGSVIESSTHVTIRDGRQDALARNVIIVEFDAHAAGDAAVSRDLVWWQQLRNPHLVEIISAARNDEGLTLVLDQAACTTIGMLPQLGRPAQALLVCQALEALSVIHDAGRAHGHVGVDSILVDTNGLARLGLPGLSTTTIAFHAPELSSGQRTPPGDLYAAGRVLEHLAGTGTTQWAPIIELATAAVVADRYPSALLMRQAIDAAMTDEEGRDWVAVAFSGLAAATATLLVAGSATGPAMASNSITVAGISTNTVPPPPPGAAPLPAPSAVPTTPPPPLTAAPPAPPLTPPAPARLVPLRAGRVLRRTRRWRMIVGGAGTVALAAAVITGLVIFSGGKSSRSAAPTTIAGPGSTTKSSTSAPPTTVTGPPATTVAAPVASAAFDPNALPEPIAATPRSWLWTGPAGYRLAASTVAGDNVVIAVITDSNGTATAVGLRDGAELWRHPFPARPDNQVTPYAPSIIAAGDSVIVAYDLEGAQADQGPSDLGLTSLNAADGTERWLQRLETASPGQLEHGPGKIIIVDAALIDDSQTAAIDSTDGHVLWDRDTVKVVGSPIAIRDDRVVITYWRDNETNAVDIHTGQVLYKVNGQASALAEPVLYTMTGGFGCADPTCMLQGDDATTGATLWQAPDQTGVLLGVTSDGAAIMRTSDPADPTAGGQLIAIDPTGAQRWAVPGCPDSAIVAATDVGTSIYCADGLTLHDNKTGAAIQQLPYDATSSNALAANLTLYTIVQSQVTATTLGPNAATLWSAALPTGFVTSSSYADDPYFNPVRGEAAAFDHRLLVRGHVAGGRPALAVLTDVPFTPPVQPVLTLADITSGPNVVGHAGPYLMPDGANTIVLTRGDMVTGQSETGGTVELAVERADGWHIEQVIAQNSVTAPVEIGDLTGDGRPELKVSAPTAIGGFSWDYLYRIDPAGPTLIAIPFALDELGPTIEPTQLVINSVSLDHANATVIQCKPDCADDPGITVDYVLDRTGTWSLHPTQPAPPTAPPAQTVCIRSNIDFAALRASTDVASNLLAQIPPGSCDVTLIDPAPVQRNGIVWYHAQWNGIVGWTAKSNTA